MRLALVAYAAVDPRLAGVRSRRCRHLRRFVARRPGLAWRRTAAEVSTRDAGEEQVARPEPRVGGEHRAAMALPRSQ